MIPIRFLALFLAATVTAAQAQPQIPTQKLTPADPNKTLKLKQQTLSEGQKKAMKDAAKPRAYPTRAYSSIYYAPPENFCGDKKTSQTELRAYLQYQWRPDNPEGRNAFLVVRLGTREVRSAVVLRGGSSEVASDLLNAMRTEVCPSRCVEVRFAPATPADTNYFDQRWKRACF